MPRGGGANYPQGAYLYGILVVFNELDRIVQVYYPHSVMDDMYSIWIRFHWPYAFTNWHKFDETK